MGPDRKLDLAIALEVAGYRWVTWNREAVGGRPMGRGSAFLAGPDDLLSHLHQPANGTEPKEDGALAAIPEFSRNVGAAMGIAERVGLFREGGAVLGRRPDGTWVVRAPALQEEVWGTEAAEVVCRATLAWVGLRAGR